MYSKRGTSKNKGRIVWETVGKPVSLKKGLIVDKVGRSAVTKSWRTLNTRLRNLDFILEPIEKPLNILNKALIQSECFRY